MVSLIALLLFGTAFAVTAMCTPAVGRMSRTWGWLDLPDGARKMHGSPVPTGGGIALALGIVVGLVCLLITDAVMDLGIDLPGAILWIGAGAMLLTGIYDDVRGLGFKRKFAVQVLVAYGLLYAGYRVDVGALPFVGEDPYAQALISIPLTMLWIVGVINAVNLLDGLDGLAAGVALICVAALALVFGIQGHMGLVLIGVLICGALVAFLMYNFNPASIFMGDSGSLLLGYLLAVFALEGRGHVDPIMALLIPVVILGLPITDTGLSIVRRAAARRAIFAPDRDHIHHRMLRRLDHRRAVLALYAWAVLFALAAVWMSVLPLTPALWVVGGLGVVAVAVVHHLGYFRQPFIDSIVAGHPDEGDGAQGWGEQSGDGEIGDAVDLQLPAVPAQAEAQGRGSVSAASSQA